MADYTGYPISFGSDIIKGVKSLSISTELQKVLHEGTGVIEPHGVSTLKADQKISISSADIKTAIDTVGLFGLNLATENLNLYAQKLAPGGTYATGSSHVKFVANKGVAYIESISANLDQEASVSIAVIPTTDGTNPPIVPTDSSALPTLTHDDVRFTLGTAKVGATAIPGLQSITINTGIQAQPVGGDGLPYHTEAYVTKRVLSITLTTNDVGKAILQDAQGKLGADLVVTFKKCASGALRLANATEEHIAVTLKAFQINNSANELTGPVGSSTIMITPFFDGTNDTIEVDTASAIA